MGVRVCEPWSSSASLCVSTFGLKVSFLFIHVVYLYRKAQDLKVAVEPALCGCVMVVVCWYLALTGEDLGTPRLYQPSDFPFPKVIASIRLAKTVPTARHNGEFYKSQHRWITASKWISRLWSNG